METYWFSFCDPNRSKGSQFLGVSIVDGIDFEDAHINSWLMECNPGGEIEITNITKAAHKVKPEYKYKLLTKEQCDEAIIVDNI